MSDEKFAKRKAHITRLIQATRSKKTKVPPKDVIRMRKIIRTVAKRLKINENQVIAETIMDVMCCDTHFPKVKFPTINKAREVTGGKPYPCPSCLTWHGTTTCTPKPPETFNCPGCHLDYAKRNSDQVYCCKGCRKRHNYD